MDASLNEEHTKLQDEILKNTRDEVKVNILGMKTWGRPIAYHILHKFQKFEITLYLFAGGRGKAHATVHMWGSKDTCGSQFPPFTMWAPGIELGSSG